MKLFLAKMSKYLRGKKRLQVIHNWLNGRDDPEYEVFPTASEGKYIVTKRTKAPADNDILDQIKQLGDESRKRYSSKACEIKSNRNKNEQEKMIKKEVKKQMSRQNKYHHAQSYDDEPHSHALNSSAGHQIRPNPKSRIFNDLM